MTAIPKTKLTPEEYLEFERKSEERHEYFGGEIFAMSGAKRNHNKIVGNLSGLIWQHLKGKDCEFYPTDMRVFIPETGLYTYPDLVVVSCEPEFKDDVFDTLLNPVLLIEVLSDSTEGYDRGKNFSIIEASKFYKNIFWSGRTKPELKNTLKPATDFGFCRKPSG